MTNVERLEEVRRIARQTAAAMTDEALGKAYRELLATARERQAMARVFASEIWRRQSQRGPRT